MLFRTASSSWVGVLVDAKLEGALPAED